MPRLLNDGTHFNPAIFTFLRQARGGKVLELRLKRLLVNPHGTDIFKKAVADDVRFMLSPEP
jgi:hypothetical protein